MSPPTTLLCLSLGITSTHSVTRNLTRRLHGGTINSYMNQFETVSVSGVLGSFPRAWQRRCHQSTLSCMTVVNHSTYEPWPDRCVRAMAVTSCFVMAKCHTSTSSTLPSLKHIFAPGTGRITCLLAFFLPGAQACLRPKSRQHIHKPCVGNEIATNCEGERQRNDVRREQPGRPTKQKNKWLTQ